MRSLILENDRRYTIGLTLYVCFFFFVITNKLHMLAASTMVTECLWSLSYLYVVDQKMVWQRRENGLWRQISLMMHA